MHPRAMQAVSSGQNVVGVYDRIHTHRKSLSVACFRTGKFDRRAIRRTIFRLLDIWGMLSFFVDVQLVRHGTL